MEVWSEWRCGVSGGVRRVRVLGVQLVAAADSLPPPPSTHSLTHSTPTTCPTTIHPTTLTPPTHTHSMRACSLKLSAMAPVLPS